MRPRLLIAFPCRTRPITHSLATHPLPPLFSWSPSHPASSKSELSDDKIPLRQSQLEVRHHEVYEAFKAFSSLVAGQQVDGFVIEEAKASSAAPPKSLGEEWFGKVDVEKIALGGHR